MVPRNSNNTGTTTVLHTLADGLLLLLTVPPGNVGGVRIFIRFTLMNIKALFIDGQKTHVLPPASTRLVHTASRERQGSSPRRRSCFRGCCSLALMLSWSGCTHALETCASGLWADDCTYSGGTQQPAPGLALYPFTETEDRLREI